MKSAIEEIFCKSMKESISTKATINIERRKQSPKFYRGV